METIQSTTEKSKRDYLLLREALDHGNQQAYAELLRLYRNPIYYMLLKMMNNPNDAEDLTMEAFGKAFKNLDQYSPEFAFSTWLFKIAANNCIDFMRKKNSMPNCIDQDLFNLEINLNDVNGGMPDTPEERIIEKQKIIMLRNAVDQLRPKYKQLIELRYFKEYSYEEISQELGISLGNVKIQLFRAKEMLAGIMQNSRWAI
ncbi:MAG TPA: sigma-70 family RNA polymerase sigma factor [Bacteroidales bacterium]|jgi:RNA polymerase sigma-70 factor (ECF subfamily)|nr:sigma-70 family RNA polymerase sigma factor [Bacteroidales bacterium]HPS71078.1 sigma-70 family RNA polymerase sigma factor [Bacteroidales bacterium]